MVADAHSAQQEMAQHEACLAGGYIATRLADGRSVQFKRMKRGSLAQSTLSPRRTPGPYRVVYRRGRVADTVPGRFAPKADIPEHSVFDPKAEVTPFDQCSQNTGVAKTALCDRARIALLRHSLQIGRVVPLIAPAREPKGCRELRRSFTG